MHCLHAFRSSLLHLLNMIVIIIWDTRIQWQCITLSGFVVVLLLPSLAWSVSSWPFARWSSNQQQFANCFSLIDKLAALKSVCGRIVDSLVCTFPYCIISSKESRFAYAICISTARSSASIVINAPVEEPNIRSLVVVLIKGFSQRKSYRRSQLSSLLIHLIILSD